MKVLWHGNIPQYAKIESARVTLLKSVFTCVLLRLRHICIRNGHEWSGILIFHCVIGTQIIPHCTNIKSMSIAYALLQSHLHNTNCNSDPCPTNACWKKCSQLSLSHNHHSLPLQRLLIVFFSFLFIQVWMVRETLNKKMCCRSRDL